MDLVALKWVAALSSFAVSLIGGVAAKGIAGLSPKWMQLCNAAAGGVLISVALVHMLHECAEELEGWSAAIQSWLRGEEEDLFPLGFALAGFGFFLIIGIEHLLGGHSHDEPHSDARIVEQNGSRENLSEHGSEDGSTSSRSTSWRDDETPMRSLSPTIAGLSTLIGISIHSFIEGAATGAATSADILLLLLGAALCHKGFAGFAVASSLIALGDGTVWWLLLLFFSLMTPLGILTGMALVGGLEGQVTAAMQCVAAGTLLAVGITDMLIPALQDRSMWKKRKLFAGVLTYTLVSMLAAWA